jgi:hypothetical protein
VSGPARGRVEPREQRLDGARERVARPDAPVGVAGDVLLGRLGHDQPRAVDHVEQRRRRAVDELGPELHRDREARHPARVDAPAHAGTRLEHPHAQPGVHEGACRGQPGRPRPDDQHVHPRVGHRRQPPVSLEVRPCGGAGRREPRRRLTNLAAAADNLDR